MAVLWQQFLAWYARIADWLDQDDHLAITLAGLALILLYIAFRRRG